LQKDWDVEKLVSQHELTDLRRKFVEQRTKFDNMEENHKSLSKTYSDILETVETIGKDIQSEREKSCALENELTQERLKQDKDSDVWI
jgi:vacuolar-type H+-ATPase catalytic subunit A/Vma1